MKTDKQMLSYWTKRVVELESMRPMTQAEAIAEAEKEEAQAAIHQANYASRNDVQLETGRVADGDTVADRGMRNAQALGSSRNAQWGESTRANQCLGRAKALRKIAEQPEGDALVASLTDARAKRDYYAGLCAK